MSDDGPVEVSRIRDFFGMTPGTQVVLPGGKSEVYARRGSRNSCSPSCPGNHNVETIVTIRREGNRIIRLVRDIPENPGNIYYARAMDLRTAPVVSGEVPGESPDWEKYSSLLGVAG